MKKKSLFFTLFVFIFGLCGTLGFYNFQETFTYAQSTDASVWDGTYVTEKANLTDSDWYEDQNRFFHIRSARGFSYFVYLVNKDNEFQSFKDKTVYLETDIDLAGKPFDPIGNKGIFSGIFEGNKHYIYNLNLTNKSAADSNAGSDKNDNYLGLFSQLTDYSVVRNLHIRNLSVDVSYYTQLSNNTVYIGGLVGHLNNTTSLDENSNLTYLNSCSVKGKIEASFGADNVYNLGGLVGTCSNATISNSMTDVDITVTSTGVYNQNIGGLVGSAEHVSFESCYTEGDLHVVDGNVGGLTGYAIGFGNSKSVSISNCYNSGDIFASAKENIIVGGLVGLAAKFASSNTFLTMNCSYNSGNIFLANSQGSYTNGIFYFGGLIAYLQNPNSLYTVVKNSFMVGDIWCKNSAKAENYSKVTIDDKFSYLYNVDANVSVPQSSYLYYNVSERFTNSPNSAIVNLLDLVKTREFFSNIRYWSQTDGWSMSVWDFSFGINEGLPYLVSAYNVGNPNNDSDYSGETILKGQGTFENPYLIETAADLGWVSFNHNKTMIGETGTEYYSLQNDIDLKGKTWQPIGSSSSAFNGVFEGNGHTISGITCSLQEKFGYHGLFGVTENAVIKNLIVRNINFINEGTESIDETSIKGSFIGLSRGNTYIINCTDDSTINELSTVGAIDTNSNLYVLYGKNNITLSGNIVSSSLKLNIKKIGTAKIIVGFDVVVSGESGNFYDGDKNIYKGDYHILLTTENSKESVESIVTNGDNADKFVMLQPTDNSGKIIDNTFGKTYLPKLSTSYGDGETDTLIRRGFVLEGYKYSYNNRWVGGDANYFNLGTVMNGDTTTDYCEFNLNSNPIKGIYAVWTNKGFNPDGGVDQNSAEKVTIVYNRYEQVNFNTTGLDSVTPDSNSVWKIVNFESITKEEQDAFTDRGMQNGDIYVDYYLEYDSFVYDYPELRTSPKNLDGTFLRGDDFTIKNIYTAWGGKFITDNLLKDNSLINSVFSKTLFAEWEGTEKEGNVSGKYDVSTYQISVTFVNGRTAGYETIDQDSKNRDLKYARDFELSEAINSLTLNKVYTAGKEFNEHNTISTTKLVNDFEGNSSQGLTISFGYDTRLSSSTENYLNFDLKLNRGYTFTGAIDFTSPENLGYGSLTLNRKGKDNTAGNVEEFNRINILNLVGDYNFVIDLRREENERQLVMGTGVYFGLSPMIDLTKDNNGFSNIWVKQGNSFQDLVSVFTVDGARENLSGKIGYDFFTNRVLSTNSEAYSLGCDLPSDCLFEEGGEIKDGGKVVATFRYDLADGTHRYFIYEKYYKIDIETGKITDQLLVDFYEAKNMNLNADNTEDLTNPNLEKTEFILRVAKADGNDMSAQISFLSNSTFQFIFSTEMDDLVFNKAEIPDVYYQTSTEPQSLSVSTIRTPASAKSPSKISMEFVDIYGFEEVKKDAIYANTMFTRAVLRFNMVDTDGNDIISNAPTVEYVSNIYDVATPKNESGGITPEYGYIKFDVVSNDFYEFESSRTSPSLEIYDGTFLKPNIKVTVSNANSNSGDTADQNYENDFNAENKKYFDPADTKINPTISYHSRSEEDAKDYFSIILPFRWADSGGDNAFKAGLYDFDIYCKPVVYSINFATKFVDYSSFGTDKGETGWSKIKDEENLSNIKTTVTVNDTNYELLKDGELTPVTYPTKSHDVRIGTESIHYGDNIQAKTELGDNGAYIFYKWYIKAEDYGGYISKENEKQLHFYFNENYRLTEDNKSKLENTEKLDEFRSNRYNISLFAVYRKKEVNVNISQQVLLVDENGNDTDRKYNVGSLGLTMSLNGGEANYQYSAIVQESTKLDNIKINIGGTKANGYYLYGYELVDIIGNTVSTIKGEPIHVTNNNCADIDLYTILKPLLEDKNGVNANKLSQTFYLMPLIKQKTANLFFYSGTGGVDNDYGDTLNGTVYDNKESPENTTGKVYKIMTVYMGNTIYLNQENFVYLGDETVFNRVIIDNMFASRVGYSIPSNGYWWDVAREVSLHGSQIDILEDYFKNVAASVDLHFYRKWTANKYTITFRPNGGTFTSGDFMSGTIEYDSNNLDGKNLPSSLKISKTGYDLSGWSYRNGEIDEQIFNSVLKPNGVLEIVDINQILFKNGLYKMAGNVELYAMWEARTYKIQINFNSANSVNGEAILPEDMAEHSRIYNLKFDSTFGEMFLNEDSTTIPIKISEIIPIRMGFVFDGFYAVNGNRYENITDMTILNNGISTYFNLSNYPARPIMTIYANWTFDTEFLGLTINNLSLPALTYNAQQQTIYLKQYFETANVVSKGYIIGFEENNLTINLPTEMSTEVILTLTSKTATVENTKNTFFTVRDFGLYTVDFNITVKDSAKHLNLGNVSTKSFTFNIMVNRADVESIVSSDAELLNVKRIMTPFVNTATKTSIGNCIDFDQFATFIKSTDSTIEEAAATNKDIYNYIMTKYYLIANTNNGPSHYEYKNWKYSNFVEYLAQEGKTEEVNAILAKLFYFDFYDINDKSNSKMISGYDGTDIRSTQVENLKTEILIDKIVMFSNQGAILPKNVYSIRVYLKNTVESAERLNNYNLSYDNENKAYLELGVGYLMPGLLTVENLEEVKSVYFGAGYSSRMVEWVGNRISIDYDYKTYYLLNDNIYISADLFTSNGGDKDVDTVYSYMDDTNYLYFSNITILEKIVGTSEYNDISSRFKLVMKENDTFTILNTKGIANISLTASYLTKIDGIMSFDAVKNTMATELIRITSVSYNIDGTEKTNYDTNGLETGAFLDNGVMIYEIKVNNSNSVSLFINETVTQVSFTTMSNSLNDYIKLYKWADSYIYNIDGTMENQGSFTVTKENLSLTDDGMTEVNYYAVYTDMVLVKYDFNLPDSYQPVSTSTNLLKLGSSTARDLYIPTEDGFVVSSIKAKIPSGELVDYTSIFTGIDSENGPVFTGLNSVARHTVVNLDVKWAVQDISYVQTVESLKMAVQSFDKLIYTDIVTLLNENKNIYQYNYTWKFNNEVFSVGDTLRLEKLGSFEESGQYKLLIEATLLPAFRNCLDDETKLTTSFEVTFNLEFVKNMVEKITLPSGEELEKVFDNREHINDWKVKVEYFVYNKNTDSYESEVTVQELFYITTGSIYFKVFFNGAEVTSMKNAGEYRVLLCFDEGMFDLNATIPESDKEFLFTINALSVDLSTYDFSSSKEFNSVELGLNRDLNFTNEPVTLSLRRDLGEDVGSYNIYFQDIMQEYKKNYIFKFGETVLFENGSLTSLGQTTSIGTFTITQSSTLRLSYATTPTISQNIKAPYSKEGYSLKLTNDFKMQIYNGDNIYKEFALQFYDVANASNITSMDILNLLKSKLTDINAKFFSAVAFDKVFNSLTYTYLFEVGTEFSKYYTNVEFANGFTFSIEQVLIDVSKFNFNKVYDGQNIVYMDINGNVVDLNTYSGIYVVGTYSSVHVGDNIRVELNYLAKDTTENLANFSLSSSYGIGKISKLDATMTVNLTKNKYTYGEVSVNKLDTLIAGFDIVGNDGLSKNDLLIAGYYELNYKLEGALSNDRGFLYKGTYSLKATSNFQDFNMTLTLPTFEVEAMTFNKIVSRSSIVVTALDVVSDFYEESITIPETGDEITLQYNVQGLTAGTNPPVGNYDLILKNSVFLDGSVVVAINENNQGFEVLLASETLYMRFVDETILSKTYNGNNFEISVDAVSKTITITNDTNVFTSGFDLFTKSDGGESAVAPSTITFTTFAIYTGVDTISLKNVGKYRLNLNAISSEYANIVFDKEYYFIVNKLSIDTTQFTFEKVYDGELTFDITSFNEKVTGDTVSIFARFDDSNAGENKNVSIYLEGVSSGNYQLSANSAIGKITKANAVVEIVNNSFVYGSITDKNSPTFKVLSAGVELLPSQYSVSFNITAANYSGLGYLECGSYEISLNIAEARNYNISMVSKNITITPYKLNLNLNVSGGFSTTYGSADAESNLFVYEYLSPLFENIQLELARTEGTAVGYYKVLSGTSLNGNYEIESLQDTSESGFFRITQAEERLYLLLSNEQTLDSSLAGTQINIEYDGNLYDTVSVEERGIGLYKLVLTSSADNTVKLEFNLNYYTYNATTNVYTKKDILVENLVSNIRFLTPTMVKNIGTYEMFANGTSSSNFEVRMGKANEQYCFYLNISKRQLYFKESTLSKVFDNQLADFVYEDAKELLNNVVESETIGLKVQFTQNGEVVKYAGVNYNVVASISGPTIANYDLNMTTADGTTLKAFISRADMTFVVNSQNVTYGEEINLVYDYSTAVDLSGYDLSRLSFSLSVDARDNYSTSGALRVGEYNMLLYFVSQDFNIAGYMVDNAEHTDLTAKLIVSPKQLELSAKTQTLQEIFTKVYDGTNSVKILDDSGQLLFGLSGINSSLEGNFDAVSVSSASYANEYIGQNIEVSFVLSGADKENYTLSPWLFGVIEPVVVSINFDYKADGSTVTSNVDDSRLQTLSQISFPFMSSSYLTSNSISTATNSTKNFPISLTGKTGFLFTYWTMDFNDVAPSSTKYTFLSSLVSSLNMESFYVGNVFSVRVDNGEKTVRFLDTLIQDSQDLFGLYFKTNSNISVTFNANWSTNKYRISLQIADESGNNASLGSVEVDDEDASTENIVVTTNYLGEYEYDGSVSFRATANEHCNFYGFYTADGKLLTGTEPYIKISKEGDVNILRISSIRQVYNFVVRYSIQKVNVILDFTGFSDVTIDSTDFVNIGGQKYQWATDYLTLDEMYLSSLPEIQRVGFDVVSLSTASTTVSKENFASTKFTSLIPASHDEILTLTLTPDFEAVGVVVTLDYGYDELKKNISVPFGQTYNSSADWEDTPERTGYTFAGWFNDADTRVYGTDIMNIVSTHTLTAKWTINKYSIELVSPNSTVFEGNVEFVKINNSYIANELEYGSTVTFKVSANAGYEISQHWQSVESVTVSNGVAFVTIKVPARNFVYELPIIPLQNHVSVSGDRIASIRAYDITETETELTVFENKFDIATGRKVRIVATAVVGYYVTEDLSFDDGLGLVVSKRYENGSLIIEIEGIKKDIQLTLSTAESKNKITVEFDTSNHIEVVIVNDITYSNVADLPVFEANTNSTFTIYAKFVHGYMLNYYESAEFTINHELITSGAYSNYYKIDVTDISTDGTIKIYSTVAKFTLTMEVISYDENKNRVEIEENKAFANEMISIEVDFNTQVSLTTLQAELYSFAGWSRDGMIVFSSVNPLNYTVTSNETIYAIFSTLKFDITFATYNYYTIYNEYNDPSKVQSVYTEIPGGRYFDAETNREISNMDLYYGANKTIKYKVPTGYMYYGFGYKDLLNNFVYLSVDESTQETVEVNVSSLLLNEEIVNLKLYLVVKAYSVSLNIESKLDIDGVREEDVDGVGKLNIQAQNGNSVNRYGYIDGTKVHYGADDYVNGNLVDTRKFEVVGYTGDVVYLKVRVDKAGYKFHSVSANRQEIDITKILENEDYILFEISNLIGGLGDVDIDVLFKPFLNIINLSFLSNNIKVDGGAFTFNINQANQRKVWTSGREYSSVVVSAYTGSFFEVNAFIRAGYYIDLDDLTINDLGNFIVEGSLSFQSLSIVDSGYTGKITFMVADYLGVNNIEIVVKPTKYIVALKEENQTLAEIKNVTFNSALNLTQYNADNITIVDERIQYVNGKLKVDLKKTNYNFEGFFTYQNGAGIQYINSSGESVNSWQESGYVLNTLTGKYQLGDNASLNPETGEITISIYLYWSYLKTRISFEFVPAISTSWTAQDMVTGIDYTNSWFYETAPLYIEVSFNTDIHIKAPTISGYKFYKFVISQKNAEGTWLSDVTSFADDVPWSTNEFDRIVECKIQVIYFAQIDVTTFGGDGSYQLAQELDDTQARILLQQGYVDTSKPFSIEAIEGDGYQFLRWVNSSTGQSTFTKTMTLTVNKRTTLVMNLQGLPVTLNFEDYDSTFGQIISMKTESRDNSFKNYRLGGYVGDDFTKLLLTVDVKVGDKLTFVLAIDYGFGVVWNRNDIEFVEYTGGMYYFSMTVLPADAIQSTPIIPQFKDEILSIYINSSFVDEDIKENTIDLNIVSLAGHTTYNGKKTSFVSAANDQEVRISTITKSRYEIASLKIKNYDNIFVNSSEFFTEDGVIVLTPEYLKAKNIVGTIQILIEYRRLLWENELLEKNVFEGEGTSRNPYQIGTVEDLILFMQYVNTGKFSPQGIRYKDSHFILTADLDLGEKFWTPVGTEEFKFNGSFNFNQHTITNIYTAYFFETISFNGLFGVLGNDAEILLSVVSLWYVYLIVAIVGVLISLLVLLILINRKRKKIRETLAKK